MKLINFREKRLIMSKKILFWNLNKQDVSDIIISIVNNLSIDVIILAEFNHHRASRRTLKRGIDLQKFICELNHQTKKTFKSRFISGQKIVLLDNFQNETVIASKEDKRMSFCTYEINREQFMIAGVHLRDKYSNDSHDLYSYASQHRQSLDENHQNVKKIIVVGDFNMNPFEQGMMGFMGFNAIFSKEEILYNSQGRKFGDEFKPFYYNASWEAYNLVGSQGTYYYDESNSSLNPYWHILDQVLFSPELMDSYVTGSFNIITKVPALRIDLLREKKSKSTRNVKKIIDKQYSDHLPITFEVDI
jgi:exonuclease III